MRGAPKRRMDGETALNGYTGSADALDLTDPRDPISVRRRLHSQPELGFCEIRTADLVWRTLARLGWSVTGGPALTDTTGYPGLPPTEDLEAACREAHAAGVPPRMIDRLSGGHTSLIAELEGNRPGPTVAVRVDIDALPVRESDSAQHQPFRDGYASAVPGRMHACGHDGHVAIGLDLAARLSADRDFPGRVRLIMQAAEEGVRGAALLAAAGVCDDVDTLLAFHLGFGVPTGEVSPATDFFATSKLRATFTGTASHAGNAPEKGRHALLAAATATLSLHGLPRFADATTRVNVGTLRADGAPNIVPARAELQAELRASRADVHAELERRAYAVLEGAAAMQAVELAVVQTGQATTASNDENVLRIVRTAASATGLTPAAPRPLHASDDATLLMRATQDHDGHAAYVLIGSGTFGAHHSPTFDIDESVLPKAAALLEAAIHAGLLR